MKSLNQLARVAYAAYWCRKHSKPYPEATLQSDWLALPCEQQACWIEAARAVYEEVKHIH